MTEIVELKLGEFHLLNPEKYSNHLITEQPDTYLLVEYQTCPVWSRYICSELVMFGCTWLHFIRTHLYFVQTFNVSQFESGKSGLNIGLRSILCGNSVPTKVMSKRIINQSLYKYMPARLNISQCQTNYQSVAFCILSLAYQISFSKTCDPIIWSEWIYSNWI